MSAAERRRVITALYESAGRPKHTELVTRSGLSLSAVERALRGVVDPKWSTALRLILALGGEPEDYRPLWIEPRVPRQRGSAALEAIAGLAAEVQELRQEFELLRKDVSG